MHWSDEFESDGMPWHSTMQRLIMRQCELAALS
jgi:hypothetical protein